MKEEVKTVDCSVFLRVILRRTVLGQEPEEVLTLKYVELLGVFCIDTGSENNEIRLHKAINVLLTPKILK